MTALTLALPAAGFYFTGAIRQWLTIAGKSPSARPFVVVMAAIGAVLHLAALSMTLFSDHVLNLAMFQVGSLISLMIVLLVLSMAWNKSLGNLFAGLLPLAGVICLCAALFDHQVLMSHLSYELGLHILLSILAFSLFTIAAVHAILIILQDRQLRQHRMRGLLQSLPALQTMDALLFRMIWVGMALLTAAFIVGYPAIEDIRAQHLTHKIVFAIIGWLVFAILLFSRYRFGWRGAIAGGWTLAGTAFLILSYFGSQFVLEYVLGNP